MLIWLVFQFPIVNIMTPFSLQVYSQRNLKHMIASAEASLTESSGTGPKSLVPGVCTPSHLSATVRQYINELEGPSFSYVPLFGPETTVLIRNVLTAAAQAKANLRSSQIQQPVMLIWLVFQFPIVNIMMVNIVNIMNFNRWNYLKNLNQTLLFCER